MIRFFLPAIAVFFALGAFAQSPAALDQEQYTLASIRRMRAVQFLMGPCEPLAKKSVIRRHRYEVRLKGDSTFQKAGRIERYGRGDIFVMGGGHNYDIIKPDSTVRMNRIVNNRRKLEGVPHKGGWVFRIVTGAVRGYSPYPEETLSRVVYMQLEPNGPIEVADVQRLGEIMEGNEAALALLRRKKIGAAMERYNQDVVGEE
ncbi:hypothetical protein KK062_10140 [Fulvivirgaceae bacterium PWU5]|uniref:Uncharacterized protein n=1 Tax=Dawidia cretensis TaxID=2782350 RepID=A0AAP2DYV8_9BACT|nr:hypothetical protein [Dawidia cretensis]MBT1708587.1 hypothetical protein [Dawidia cretensis]